MPFVPVAELKQHIGKDAGYSDWLTIDQQRINLFADATGDFQFIHVDPVKAAQTPFGATIAHGFLSLSLIPQLMEGIMVLPEGLKMAVNYGIDSVRFVQPVTVNSRVRLKVQLTDVSEKNRTVVAQGNGHAGDRRSGKTRICGRTFNVVFRVKRLKHETVVTDCFIR